eukprot:g32745.t1
MFFLSAEAWSVFFANLSPPDSVFSLMPPAGGTYMVSAIKKAAPQQIFSSTSEKEATVLSQKAPARLPPELSTSSGTDSYWQEFKLRTVHLPLGFLAMNAYAVAGAKLQAQQTPLQDRHHCKAS